MRLPRAALPVVAALVALPLVPVAAAPAPQSVLVLDGRGRGHGVGMAQDSANAMAAAGATHEQILQLFYPGTSRARRSSALRVAVWEAGTPYGSVTVVAPGGARVSGGGRAADAPPGAVLRVTAAPSGFSVRQVTPARGAAVRAGLVQQPSPSPSPSADPLPDTLPSPAASPQPGGTASPSPSSPPPGKPSPAAPAPPAASPAPSPSGAASFSFDSSGPITLAPSGGAGLSVTTTGRRYRGSLIALSREGFRLVNAVDVEDYLRGLGEVPASWPMAALRTQAVAARTYALRSVGGGQPLGYDICDDTRCQVYLGMSAEHPRTTAAARETRGEVVTYRGALADTFYSANAGGVTATPAEGFGGSTTIPYLPAGIRAPGDVDPWRLAVTPADVARRLRYPGRLDAVTVAQTGPSGRATRVRLEGSGGVVELGGVDFQRRLGLRSTLFTVTRGTGAAQALPPASAAAVQLAPGAAAAAPAVPEPSAAPSPAPLPSAAATVPLAVAGPSAEGVPAPLLAAAVTSLGAALTGVLLAAREPLRRRRRTLAA